MGVGSNGGTSTLGQWDFFNHPFYIIFDVAVGGGFPGPPGSGTVMPQFMNIDYVRVYQAAAANGPTSLTASALSNSQVQLNWNASTTSDPGLTYNIFRSTSSGTEHSSISDTNFSTMIATGVTATSFTDTMLTPGTTYYYEVSATGQESGESATSNEASVAVPQTGTNAQAIAISAGSLAGTQNFVQDTGYSAGATNAYPDVIDTSGVANPAPQGVYRTERWGATTYTIPNLTPNVNATVRLHFAETAFAAAGQRAFNVAINGTQVLTNYDIFADAGAEFKATEKVFSTAADSNGNIAIAFTAGTNGAPHTNPSIRGIEVIPAGGACSPPTTPTNFTATAVSSSQINLSWTASTGQPCGGAVTYKVSRNGTQIATGLSSTTYDDTGLTASTMYSYTVAAVNSAGSSATASASATTEAGTTSSIEINSGGPAVSPFVADEDFSGGGTISHANTIDLSGVTNPAPMAVYQTGRDGNFTYTIPGFTANSSHTVRLHFAETYWSSAGSRVFNVSINGTTVLTNFDIFAAAGAKNKAVIEQFSEPANSSGQYVIKFTTVKDNSLVSGIEIQ
jgi:fibronectin type 3 domain-containing protein